MSDAKSKADTDAAQATAGGAGVTAGQASGGAAGSTAGYSEGSHKQSTDVNTEESISTYNGLQVQRATTHATNVDNLAIQALQNAVETANMVSKQAVRHSDLAIDRQWNVNETDAFATILAERIAARLNPQG